MSRARSFLPPAGFLVCAIAFLSYPLFFVRFPATRDAPWANWLLFALGLTLVGMGLLRAFRQPERYRGRITSLIFGVLSLGIVGFFLHMTEVASRELPVSANAPRVGEKAPDFTLANTEGRPVRLSELLSPNWVLLIFYRGHW